MTKVFISQPMNGRTYLEIEQERQYIIKKVKKYFANVEIISTFIKDAPHDAKPLWLLGKSLEILSTADMIVFSRDWEDDKDCRIEHECAAQYGIKIAYIYELL